MAFRKITQMSPLKWYTSESLVYYERYGKYTSAWYVDPVPLNQIPSFSFFRGQTGDAISYFRLKNVVTGALADITLEIKAAGLRVDQFPADDYDAIVYPASVKILGVALDPGGYQAIMSDGVTEWTSECFNMVPSTVLARMMKITWCNNDPIPYDIGNMSYANGLKHKTWLKSTIWKPQYPKTVNADTRQGQEFDWQKIAYKEYQFQVVAPEYVFDTLHYMSIHSKIEIEEGGVCYTATDVDLGEVDWQPGGDHGTAVITFRANTIAIKKTGSGTDCTIVPGSCIDTDYQAKAITVNNSILYNNGEYEDANGDTQSLDAGDFVLVSQTGIAGDPLTLEQWNGSSYVGVISLPGLIVYNEKNGGYYFLKDVPSGYVLPAVANYDSGTNTLTGHSLPGVVNEVWVHINGMESFVGVYSTTEIENGVVLPTLPAGAEFLFLRVGSPICGSFYDSAFYPVTAIGCTIDLHGSYSDIIAASSAGISTGQEWESDDSATMGVPEGIVFEYQGSNSYNDQNDAYAGGLLDGDCFSLAISNPWGLPQDMLVVLGPTTVYDDDAAADSGGVAIGEKYYLSANNTYGLGFGVVEGIVKIRKA